MEGAPALLDQASVGDLARERVDERELDFRVEACLVDELGLAQADERGAELLGGRLGDGPEEPGRDRRSDRGRGLQDPLVLGREPVDPAASRAWIEGGTWDPVERSGQPIPARLTGEHSRLDQGPDALLEEEGVAARPVDQARRQRLERGVVAKQRPQQLLRAGSTERVHADLRVGGAGPPAMLVLRPAVDEHGQAPGGEALGETVDDGFRLSIDPVEVLDDEEDGPDLALAAQQPPDRLSGLLPPLRRVQVPPPGVLHRHLQQGQDRRDDLGEAWIEPEEVPGDGVAEPAVVVALVDPEVASEQTPHREVRRSGAVGDRAPLEDQPARRQRRAGDLPDEARLADARLADERRDLAMPIGGPPENLGEGSELVLAPDERRETTGGGGVEAQP